MTASETSTSRDNAALSLDCRHLGFGPFPPATFGVGAVSGLPAAVREAGGDRALLVSDRGLAGSPLLERVADLLRADGVGVEVYAGVHPNPLTTDIDEGVQGARSLAGRTVVVAVGGGSAIDAAKGIALGATNPRPAHDLDYRNPAAEPALPLVCVPTTSGTGAETNAFGVVTDVRVHKKFYVGNASCLPRRVILDPELTLSLPKGPTAASGIDALTHAIESYLSVNANPYADALDLQVVTMVSRHLVRAVDDGASDLEARAQLQLASHLAGICLSQTGLGIVHGLAHPLGGRYDLSHGLALALVLPTALEFNRSAREQRLAHVAVAFGAASPAEEPEKAATAGIRAIGDLAARVGLPSTLREAGVAEPDIDQLVEDTLADEVLANTPVWPTAEDLRRILSEVAG